MGFTEAVAAAFRNYVNFRDRASRSEYWWFFLFIFVANLVLGAIEGAMGLAAGHGFLSMLFGLVTFIPGLAVGARRLHDADRSGWWLLLGFVPLIGIVVLLIWFAQRGTPGTNRFGPDPLGGDEEDAAWEV